VFGSAWGSEVRLDGGLDLADGVGDAYFLLGLEGCGVDEGFDAVEGGEFAGRGAFDLPKQCVQLALYII
jgi:hypothetical protein